MSGKKVNITQRLWGWRIAVYLFLLSAAAGAYVTVFLLKVIQPDAADAHYLPAVQAGMIAAAVLAVAGVFFFVAHLKAKVNAFRIFARPFSSWLAAGSYATLLFIILDVVLIAVRTDSSSGSLAAIFLVPGIIAFILALFILVYSGMLIKVLKPFSFWHSWLLPLLFTVSGVAAGAVLVLLLAAVYGFISAVNMSEPLLTIVYYLNFLLLACIVIAALYIGHAALSFSLRSTVLVLIKGRSALLFWAAFVLLGLVLPLVAGFYLVSLPSVSTGLLYTLLIIIALCVMTGGYVLRYLILTSGTAKVITASGQQVELHETAFIPVSHRVKYRAD